MTPKKTHGSLPPTVRQEGKPKKVNVDAESARKDKPYHICGADILVKNVLPLLQLECVWFGEN